MGGKESTSDQHEFMASLFSSKSGNVVKGGAVVSDHYILTSGGMYDKTKLVVYVGGKNLSNSESMEIEEVLLHLNYSYRTHTNLALMKTSKPIAIKSIPLAKEDFPNQSGIAVKVLGYGGNS